MPTYCYKCKMCSEEFEVRHSMNYEEQHCIKCYSEQVFKIPSLGMPKISKPTASKTGKIVDEYIEDVKKEIKREKIKLKSEEM